MNRLLVIVLAGLLSLAFTSRASADLIVNGGFETGDFTGWTPTLNGSNSGVDGFHPHSGTYGAYFDAVVSNADLLEQEVQPAVVGTTYTLSFWLNCLDDRINGPANFWNVYWNGALIDGQINRPDDSDTYVQFTYQILATQATNNFLTFEFGNEVGGFELDDVSLTEVPVPAGVILFGMGAAGLALMNLRRRYLSKPV